jgi:2-amino-4-hydroxy-6-hydroxymethyldihydropteridine diphosphokinase
VFGGICLTSRSFLQQFSQPPGSHWQGNNSYANVQFEMIVISLGSNVTSRWGSSQSTLLQALIELQREGVRVLRSSRLYRTVPYGLTNQPDFTNAVAVIHTSLAPHTLLAMLKSVEARAGRRSSSSVRWGPRALDLDIVDYNHRILNGSKCNMQVFNCSRYCTRRVPKGSLILPHPGMAFRPFVLQPLHEVAPHWHHPVTGLTAMEMLKKLRFAPGGGVLSVDTL